MSLPRFHSILTGAGALALALAVVAAPGIAAAQTTTQAAPAPATGNIPVVIGILDTETVVLGSNAGKSVTQQANAQLRALQENSQKQEDALVAKLKELDAKRSANPPISVADYNAQRQALAAADDKIRADFDKNKQALDGRVEKARQSLLAAASKVIQEIAKARGLTLILARTSAPLFPQQWNITDDVLQRLNKTLPAIKL